MNNIFISYIIPCYNVEKYLPICIESLRHQIIREGLGIEYIFVNDGSTDETLSILQDFAENDSRAVVIDQKNQGVSSARNAGLIVAKGKYVFFLDSDDWLTDDASQTLYDACKCGEPDIIITNAYIVNEVALNEKKKWSICIGLDPGIYDTMEFARKVHRLPVSFKTYKRELLMNHHIFYNINLRVGEVYAFFIVAMTCSHTIAFTDKRIMYYLVRSSGVMRTLNIERDRTIINTIHYIEDNTKEIMPELCSVPSYIRSLYDIINLFGIINYVKKTAYSSEIGDFLSWINKDDLYKKLQRYFIFKEWGLNGRTKYAILLHYFPIPFTYRLLRFVQRK